MKLLLIRARDFTSELVFSASRSGGAGGQNVNKVNTKVELRFSVAESALLSEEEKAAVAQKLAHRINDAGELLVVSQTGRTQGRNRETAVEKFYQLLEAALRPAKKRRATKPSRAAREKRLTDKRLRSETKQRRKPQE